MVARNAAIYIGRRRLPLTAIEQRGLITREPDSLCSAAYERALALITPLSRAQGLGWHLLGEIFWTTNLMPSPSNC